MNLTEWKQLMNLSGTAINIDDIPSEIDVAPVRHGKWLCSDDIYETAVCSVCNFDTGEPYEYVKKSWNFCPNCGAKMERKEE